MSAFELVMPKLGESIIEATITRWLKKEGDTVSEDEPMVEIATDKVDSEIPSPVAGVIKQILFKENDVVAVGKVIAVILMGDVVPETSADEPLRADPVAIAAELPDAAIKIIDEEPSPAASRFYSPLVKSIARQEKISIAELETIPGTGKDARLTKDDLLAYLKARDAVGAGRVDLTSASTPNAAPVISPAEAKLPQATVAVAAGDEIIEMDRMRRLIADHMVGSVRTSPHVTSFIEVDVTNLVRWREKVKDLFLSREGEKLTLTPIFIEAVAQALKEFPNVNASVDGYKIIRRKNINIGMAAALPNGNLIVPVIKNADQKNLLGVTKEVNRLADSARNNKLDHDDIAGGTFTITNLGTFGSLTGTPIINQPQVAILGIGVVKKKPVVIETAEGDMIAVRHMMILSLSYDHRVVDGALGGMFIRRVAEILEKFDLNRSV